MKIGFGRKVFMDRKKKKNIITHIKVEPKNVRIFRVTILLDFNIYLFRNPTAKTVLVGQKLLNRIKKKKPNFHRDRFKKKSYY